MVLAKPHCGLSASRSSGTYFAASSMRRLSSFLLSSFGDLVVTRPSTAILPSLNRSGANEPARGVSYSRKKPSTSIWLNDTATGS